MYSSIEDLYINYKLYKPTISIGLDKYELLRVDHYGKNEYHVYGHITASWCLKIRIVKGKPFEIIFSENRE